MKRSKQCTLFEFDFFCENEEMGISRDTVVVNGTYVKCTTAGKVGSRYVSQGGQTEIQGKGNFFGAYMEQMFVHPGLKAL